MAASFPEIVSLRKYGSALAVAGQLAVSLACLLETRLIYANHRVILLGNAEPAPYPEHCARTKSRVRKAEGINVPPPTSHIFPVRTEPRNLVAWMHFERDADVHKFGFLWNPILGERSLPRNTRYDPCHVIRGTRR